MLTTYERLMADQRVTRTREATYDGRNTAELMREYEATVDALRAEVQRLRQSMKLTVRGTES